MKKYKIRYDIAPGEFTKEELKEKGWGGADAVLLASVVQDEKGWVSTAFAGRDGRDGTFMTASERFRVWVALAHHLMDDPELGEGRRELCRGVHEIVKKSILEAREEKERVRT